MWRDGHIPQRHFWSCLLYPSEIALGHSGRTITQDRLCEIYMELQEKKANNINLVTAGHYLPIVIESIKRARKSGLTIPIVYNSSGYEKVEAIEALDGLSLIHI